MPAVPVRLPPPPAPRPPGHEPLSAPDPTPAATPRNATIDVAKGLGILLVVLGHNALARDEDGLLFRGIYAFHVPLFFFLAGLTFKPGARPARFIADRADGLLKPCMVVALGFWLGKSLPRLLHGVVDEPMVRTFLGIFYGTGGSLWPVPLWFLPQLFTALVCCMLVMRLTPAGRSPAWLLGAAAALLALGAIVVTPLWTASPKLIFTRSGGIIGLPWGLDLMPLCAGFVLLGRLLQPGVMAMRWHAASFLLAVGGFVLLLSWSGARTDLNVRTWSQPLACTVAALMGIHAMLSLSVLLQRHGPTRRVLAWVGTGSLFILLFHSPIQTQAHALAARAGSGALPAGLAAWALGVTLPLLLWEGARRQRWLAALLLPRRPVHPSGTLEARGPLSPSAPHRVSS